MQLFVLGMHRAGTSAVARILNLMGAYFGPEGQMLGAAPDNPKGHWERLDVLEINDWLIQSSGAEWYRIANFETANVSANVVEEFENRVEKILMEIDAHRPWVIKDPRLCLLFPLWRPLLEVPVCIHVHRSPIQIAQSLHTHHGLSLPVGIALWEKYTLRALEASTGLPRIVVSYKALVENPVETVRQLYEELTSLEVQGLRLPGKKEITSFIDPKLFRERGNRSLQDEFINHSQSRLIEILEQKSELKSDALSPLSRGSQEVLLNYEKQIEKLEVLQNQIQHHYAEKEDLNRALTQQVETAQAKENEYHRYRQELENKLQAQCSEIENLNLTLKEQTEAFQAKEDEYSQRRQQLENKILEQGIELADLNRYLAKQAGQYQAQEREYKQRLQALEKQSQQQAEELEKQAEELETKTQQILALQNKMRYQEESLRTLTRLLEKFSTAAQITFESLTWKIGYFTAEIVRKITFRRKELLIQDHVQQLQTRFLDWKRNYFHKHRIGGHTGVADNNREIIKMAACESQENQYPKEQQAFSNTRGQKDKIHIAALVATRADGEPSGSAYIRLIQPLNHPTVRDQILFTECGSWKDALTLESDIILVQRNALLDPQSAQTIIAHCKEKNIGLVYEIDDDLSSANNKKETKRSYPKPVLEAIELMIRKADRVITSSRALQKQLEEKNTHVCYVPNSLDETIWLEKQNSELIKPVRHHRDDCVRILYMGTRTHIEDLQIVKKAYKKIKREYGDSVILEVVGGIPACMKTFGEVISPNGSNPGTDDYLSFVSWIRNNNHWDFGIIPLTSTKFNRQKSYIKFLDYSALGLASICSDIEPYQEVVEDRRNGLLVANDTDSWYEAIKLLIEDVNLRHALAENALHDLHQKHLLQTNAKNYLRVYQELLENESGDEGTSELPDFDEESYLSQNPDITEAIKEGQFISARQHWEICGHKEVAAGLRTYRPGIVVGYGNHHNITPDRRRHMQKEINQWSFQPLISIVMPVYNVEKKWLDKAVDSVKKQIYPYWELCIADDCSTREETVRYLCNLQSDERIRIAFLKKNQGISGASNEALALTQGEYIALLDNDDELSEDALYEVVKIINEEQPDLIYSDEDKITLEGELVEPHFKPDFSPDTILSHNYISHLGVYRKSIVDKIGGFRKGFEGSQDYDLLLRFLEKAKKVYHIPKVLYHWRKVPGSTAERFHSKSYAWEAGRQAIQEATQRRKINAEVLLGSFPGTYRVKRKLLSHPLVSILIPFKDKPDLLRQCVSSILEKSAYSNFEIIAISNNSTEPLTFALMNEYQEQDKRILFKEYNIPFNFSAINNYAAKFARGKHLILLNNDVEIISSDWIEALLEHSQRIEIGAVGAKLFYPDDCIQHAGIVMGLIGLAGHVHRYFEKEHPGYFGRLNITQNISAVTAACLMVKKSLFEEIGGLDDKNLAVAFNDVDFCLRLREKGYLNIYTPYCEAYHYESISRGHEDTIEKQVRFRAEVDYMRKRHAKILKMGDPFYNLNLTSEKEDFSIRVVDEFAYCLS